MEKGFTLVEVLVTALIAGLLSMFVLINVMRPQSSASLQSAVNTLTTDLSSQQLKSMSGERGILEASPSGIFFGTTSYTLFTGGNYKSDDPGNFVVDLPANTKFSEISFPSSSIIFATTSGEVVNFSPSQNFVTIQWSDFATKKISINKYGRVTNIQ